MSDPFGAHHHPFGKRTDGGSGTASYFGTFGDGQESNNPFAFVGNVPPMGQGVQQNFVNPLSGNQPRLSPAPVVDKSNTAVLGTMVGESLLSTSDIQHQHSTSSQVATNNSSQQHSVGSLNVTTTTTGNDTDMFLSKLGELGEDPFDSSQQPRSNSSQAQHSDGFVGISRGSSSAPVTGLVGSSHYEHDGDILDEKVTLSKLLSLPSSSSGSLIERPPLSMILPPPSANTMTNATLPNSQCLSVVHSYPYLHVLTNATNADTGGDSTILQHSTNAVGYPTSETESLMKSASDVVTPYPDDNTTSNIDEKDYITLARDKMLAPAVDSLSSSLNQSMSSLLESQEDITHQSPVQILPPAPETQPIAHVKGFPAPVPTPSSITHEHGRVVPTVDMQTETPQSSHENTYSNVVSDALPSLHQYSYPSSSIPDATSPLLQPAAYSNTQSLLVNTPLQTNSSLNNPHSMDTNSVLVSSVAMKREEVVDPPLPEPIRRISQPTTTQIPPMVPHTLVSSVVQPPPNVSSAVQPPPHVSSVVQPPPHVSSVVQPPPHVSSVVQPPPHVSSVVQPPPHVSSVVQPPPQVGSVVQPLPHASSAVQPPPHVSSVVQPPPHVSSVVQPLPHASSAVQPPPHVSSVVQPPPQVGSVVQPLPHASSAVQPPPHVSSVVQPPPHVSSVVQPPPHASSAVQPPPHVSSVVQPPPHVSSTTTVPFEERTNASTLLTSEQSDATRIPPQIYSNITAGVSDGSILHQQDSHYVITSQSLSTVQNRIQSHSMMRPLHVSQASTQGVESLSVTQNVQFVKNVSNPPLLPPQDSILSNAHQPGILSNAHHYSQLTHSVPSNAPVSMQGVLSNAHLHQYTPRSLVTGAPSTAVITPSEPVATQPIHAEHVYTAVNTFTVPPPLVLTKHPHPQDVTLHQAPITNNLPSTPDSVFAHSTTESPLVMSNAVTGTVTAVTGLPHHHNQSELLSSSGLPSTPPKVHLTQAHNIGISTQIHPVQASTSFSSTMTHVQVTSSLKEPSIVQRPGIMSHVPFHQHFQSNTNAVTSNPQSVPTSSRYPPQAAQHSVTTGVVPPTPQISSSVPTTGVNYQSQMHSTVSAQSSVPSGNIATTQSMVTPQLDQRDVSAAHTRHTGEQQAPPHYPPPPPASRHHHTTEHLLPTSHLSQGYGGNTRPLRHMTEIHHRDQYDDHYYSDDPYRNDRGGHYSYDDPHYADYYRERPGSRAPYGYPRGHYEHDAYAAYDRYPNHYDPYSGHYYYDPYAYPDPRGDYGPYPGYDDYYEHPHPPRDVPQHSHYREGGHDPQGYTEEGYPTADQSTIPGISNVFEEGGTFVDSPNVRGGTDTTQRHLQQQSLYSKDNADYSQEIPVQPLWDVPDDGPSTNEPLEPPLVLRRTPELFAHPHLRASFAPGGTLVMVLPHNLRAFQRAEVELSHVTELVSDTVHSHFVRAVSEFPGPLMPGETPKSVAVSYASRQAEQCRVRIQAEEEEEEMKNTDVVSELHDEALLWDFLVLLCQQNGVVVASDISDLLTREKTMVIPTQTHMGGGDQEVALEDIRQLLIAGRKRDALELACSQCLWGHALMLASKMDEQSRTYVINRFTASLVTTDPLSTFYTLMLGRTPSAVKPEGLRRAGNWRPHLAMILANRTNKLDNSSIVTLGDSLLDSGRLCAAHFCYHLADIQFGAYGSNTTAKYLLLGAQNSQLGMGVFPRPEYLRKMEVFEYAMSLGKQEYVLPHFQVFKYLLALQLTQVGMVAKAFKYCEQIALFIDRSPRKFPPTLLHVVDQLSTQLHHLNHPQGVVETELPSWLLQLQQTSTDVLAGNYNYTSSARSTPSPTFSSVSQAAAYDGGPRNNTFATGRYQNLKVPGGSYKGGSNVESSTATSSKEGSVIAVGVGRGGNSTQVIDATGTNDSYLPSSTLTHQQQQTASDHLAQSEEEQQQPPNVFYDQQVTVSEDAVPVTSGSNATVNAEVPYYGTYTDSYPTTTSAGEQNLQSHQPSSEYNTNTVIDSTTYGVASTATNDNQHQPPLYVPSSEHQQFSPSDEYGQLQYMGQEQTQHYDQQQDTTTSMHGHMYSQPVEPGVSTMTQGGLMHQQTNTNPATTTTNESQYNGASSYWDNQQPLQSSEYGSGGGTNEGVTHTSSGDTDRDTKVEEEEEKENKQGNKSSDNGTCTLYSHDVC